MVVMVKGIKKFSEGVHMCPHPMAMGDDLVILTTLHDMSYGGASIG